MLRESLQEAMTAKVKEDRHITDRIKDIDTAVKAIRQDLIATFPKMRKGRGVGGSVVGLREAPAGNGRGRSRLNPPNSDGGFFQHRVELICTEELRKDHNDAKNNYPKETARSIPPEAKQLLLDLGAEQNDDGRYILTTKAGRLTLHVSEWEGEEVGTVFSRFADPQAARQFVNCNRFSGKWNHHYFNGWTVETAIADLASQLRRILT